MKMYSLANGKFVNPLLVTCCYVVQIDKNIFQTVFEFGNEYKILCSHGSLDEANKDMTDFVAFAEQC